MTSEQMAQLEHLVDRLEAVVENFGSYTRDMNTAADKMSSAATTNREAAGTMMMAQR